MIYRVFVFLFLSLVAFAEDQQKFPKIDVFPQLSVGSLKEEGILILHITSGYPASLTLTDKAGLEATLLQMTYYDDVASPPHYRSTYHLRIKPNTDKEFIKQLEITALDENKKLQMKFNVTVASRGPLLYLSRHGVEDTKKIINRVDLLSPVLGR